jgi:hypothetical protein
MKAPPGLARWRFSFAGMFNQTVENPVWREYIKPHG